MVNNKQCLVSILVPIYKVEPFISRCAQSLFEQTYAPLEFIFVNDKSPDQSIKRLEETIKLYPSRAQSIQIIQNDRNLGSATTRQIAIEAAQGEYLLFVDSDDYIKNTMVEKMISASVQDDADITVCEFYELYPNLKKRVRLDPLPCDSIDFIRQILTGKQHAFLWNKLIKKDLFHNNNIHFSEGINMLDDMSVMYKLLYAARKINYVREPYYFYNKQNLNSYTTTKLNETSQTGLIKLINSIDEFINKEQLSCLALSFIQFKINILQTIARKGDISIIQQNEPTFLDIQRQHIKHAPIPAYGKIITYLIYNHHYKLARLFSLVLRLIKRLSLVK